MSRILIVCHSRDTFATSACVLRGVIPFWQAEGHEVQVQLGWDSSPPADIVIPHIALSVLPQAAIAMLSRYPNVVSRRVTDIRKRRVSSNLLDRSRDWPGPVIVKTDANFGGVIDRMRQPQPVWPIDLAQRAYRRFFPLSPPHHGRYQIYESIAAVPARTWRDTSLVVERFLPERDGDLFVIRQAIFLGTSSLTRTQWCRAPLDKGRDKMLKREIVYGPLVPELAGFCARFGVEFGKIDYTAPDGKPAILDVATTPSARSLFGDAEITGFLARGLQDLIARGSDRSR